MRKISALGVGYLVDQFAMVRAAHGEGGRAAAVGEGEDGVLRAQRQHGIDVQRRLAALRTEDEGIYALRFQFCQIAQTAEEGGGIRICRDDVAGRFMNRMTFSGIAKKEQPRLSGETRSCIIL